MRKGKDVPVSSLGKGGGLSLGKYWQQVQDAVVSAQGIFLCIGEEKPCIIQ